MPPAKKNLPSTLFHNPNALTLPPLARTHLTHCAPSCTNYVLIGAILTGRVEVIGTYPAVEGRVVSP